MASTVTTLASSAPGNSEVAIDVAHVSKRYKLYANPITGPIKELLFRRTTHYREFRAVDDVSFQVRRSEIVGIIGPNGAGKTTLLKMIAGLLPIDSGSITVRGRVNALLALGVGIHPEFSGRENIYYGALMLGMKADEIEAKMDSIVEFAELGEFINQPFRTYSSGMRSRLLFSISMSIDPDILIVDEALATGDAYFVRKCGKRIRELCSRGATILFVSHNLAQVEDMCQRAIFVAGGRVLHQGGTQEVIRAYNEWAFEREIDKTRNVVPEGQDFRSISGDGRVALEAVRLKNRAGELVSGVYTGETMSIELDYATDLPAGTPATCFVGLVRAADNQWVGEISSQYHFNPVAQDVRREDIALWPRGTVIVTMDPVLLLNNEYHLWVMFYDLRERYCEYRGIAPFFVARRAHVFDRAAVFWQPSRFDNVERVAAPRRSGSAL